MASSSHQYHAENDEVDSIPSISSSILDEDDAQREWEESLHQLQLVMNMVLIPFAGKFLGRKFAYWSRDPTCYSEVIRNIC